MHPERIAILIASALALPLLASGCSFFEPEEEDLDFDAYAGELTDMYNEGVRLEKELTAAEARIVQDCLEAQGFTVHSPDEFAHFGLEERESFLDQGPYEVFLPTVEEARLRGVFQWVNLDGAETIEDGAPWAAYQDSLTARGLSDGPPEGVGDGEFYELPPEDMYAWYVAYGGETWAEYHQGYLVGIEQTKTDAGGDQVFFNPPPGGCEREMIEAVYGGPEEQDNAEESFSDWVWRPAQPGGDWEAMNERYTERTEDAEDGLLDCLDERGFGGWEFHEGHLAVHDYLFESGEGEFPYHSYEDEGGVWPDPPGDVPAEDDTQAWLDFERQRTAVLAECGDESGFRDAAEHAWRQAQLRYYLDIEDDVYAWQEEMRGYLEAAQDVIGE
ncbi:hypothetical protein SAMN05216298_0882 [Glycomyces sambucus]|uniref:Uncharacterized protein n=1 Tax=Glycomyces sambucus TaxID=380244 RepID=A0A1G9DGJ2_9ACTN|nr:hypothetical protein [Glycomyces sambucus]SDK62988.1 hypothetical protein SAMN05216298_0882 [Glycomyces sambucus]